MCRLLAIVTNEPTEFRALLKEAPRSLRALSLQHKDGWGIAVWDDATSWTVDKSVRTADDDEAFHRAADAKRGRVLVAHVRLKTVGDARLENTHPFRREKWVFAHNGTVRDQAWLRERSSRERLAEIAGDTDSELLFAYLLTHLDAVDRTSGPVDEVADQAIARAARMCRERAGIPSPDNVFGAFNFVLSDGQACWAHRFGRTLHVLERGPVESSVRRGASDASCSRRPAVLVASEAMTDEAWIAIEEGSLVRIDRAPVPSWRLV